MTKKKKMLFGLGLPLILGSGISFLISCSEIEPAYKRQEITTVVNAPSSNYKKFATDFTTSISGITIDDAYFTSAQLFSTVRLNEPVFKKVNKAVISSTDGAKEVEYAIETPTFQYDALALAEKVILTVNEDKQLENGETLTKGTYVFDNDKHEVTPDLTNNVKTIVNLKSNDKRSINSNFFNAVLANANKMQIAIKKDIPWVKSNGEKSKYNVIPQDFFYGWNRKLLYSASYRYKNGSSKTIDENHIRDLSLGTASIFESSNEVHNDYLFKVFGVDKEKFKNESEFLTKYEGGGDDLALTFDSVKNLKPSFGDLYSKIIKNSTYFTPVSKQFIDDRNAENAKKTNDVNKGLYGETGDSLKYGYYWYSMDYDNDALYASPYLPNLISNERKVYIRNPYYSETGWKDKEKNAVLKVTYKYSQYADQVQFNNSMYRNYLEGSLSFLSWDSLTDSQKTELLNDPSQIHLRISPDKNAVKNDMWKTLIPGAKDAFKDFDDLNGGKVSPKYYFNDNYAKLMYGKTLDELSKGTAVVGDHPFKGLALAFRTTIDNAWNYYSFTKEITPQLEPWISILGPDNLIGGSDLKGETARQNSAELNKTFALDSNGNIFYTKDIEQQNKIYVENLASKEQQFKGPEFKKLQDEMKKILDEFYQKENLDASKDKIEFELNWRYTNLPDKDKQALDAVVKTINSLDSRLNVTVMKDKKDFWAGYAYGFSYNSTSSWSYDYDGAGTAIDGSAYTRAGGFYLAMSVFANLKDDDPLVKSFPEFVKYSKAAKAFLAKMETENSEFASSWKPFDKWIEAPNAYDGDYQDIFYEYEYETEADGITPKEVDKNGRATPKGGKKVYKFEGEGLNKKPVWSQDYKWVKNNTTGKWEKEIQTRKITGQSLLHMWVSIVLFNDSQTNKNFKDETLEQTFMENGKEVKKVFSHAKNKWVNAEKPMQFSEAMSIFNLQYQNQITQNQLIELAKEIKVISGVTPQRANSTVSSKPAIAIWNKNIMRPLTEEAFVPYGDILIKNEKGGESV
ncbi:OppA family ABC transporter substrate-binding lipoprotein [Mesomycoplasma lagogenitalium]|uniref:Lipoprotein n=1 Tax=Mesomycoplasma lagogenitalium TaxID=171286 RepID=A0ABY8LUC1_9BACT|nr:hypothetical protein [Mesomycoplasma lagogenitalium]WGI36832.1 hypothetical protein QEG99_00935 [Mesomycoplasma lagogenitalium]